MPRHSKTRLRPRCHTICSRPVSSLRRVYHWTGCRSAGHRCARLSEEGGSWSQGWTSPSTLQANLVLHCFRSYYQCDTVLGRYKLYRLLLYISSRNWDYLRAPRHHCLVEELFLCVYESRPSPCCAPSSWAKLPTRTLHYMPISKEYHCTKSDIFLDGADVSVSTSVSPNRPHPMVLCRQTSGGIYGLIGLYLADVRTVCLACATKLVR